MLSGYHKPEQGSLGDNEMTVVNGKDIITGISGLTCKVGQHKDLRTDSVGQIF